MSLEVLITGQVRRWHTNPFFGQYSQTNADHSWGVAVIILALNKTPSQNLLTAAILHDCHEYFCADLPTPLKQSEPEITMKLEDVGREKFASRSGIAFPDLTEEEEKWLYLADKLEAMIFAAMHNPERAKKWGLYRSSLVKLADELGVKTEVERMIKGAFDAR